MAQGPKVWDNLDSLKSYVTIAKEYTHRTDRSAARQRWQEALRRSLNWINA